MIVNEVVNVNVNMQTPGSMRIHPEWCALLISALIGRLLRAESQEGSQAIQSLVRRFSLLSVSAKLGEKHKSSATNGARAEDEYRGLMCSCLTSRSRQLNLHVLQVFSCWLPY